MFFSFLISFFLLFEKKRFFISIVLLPQIESEIKVSNCDLEASYTDYVNGMHLWNNLNAIWPSSADFVHYICFWSVSFCINLILFTETNKQNMDVRVDLPFPLFFFSSFFFVLFFLVAKTISTLFFVSTRFLVVFIFFIVEKYILLLSLTYLLSIHFSHFLGIYN